MLKKYYPKLLESDFENIKKKINDQAKFSKECIQLIKKLISNKNEEDYSSTNKIEDLSSENQKIEQQKNNNKKNQSFSQIFQKKRVKTKRKNLMN